MMRDLQLAMLNSESGLINIGAGVGAYSIAAATFRRPVITVASGAVYAPCQAATAVTCAE